MEKNVYEELFDQLLKQYDMELVRYGKNAYRVFSGNYCIDDQKICQNIFELYGVVDSVCAEGIIEDLEREAIDYGLNDFIAHPWEDALACIAKYNCGTAQERKYVKDHKWEIEVLDMLCNHLDEVDINNLDSTQAQDQVFYVAVRETYEKLVRVIASDAGEACERAMDALNCGEIECTSYKEDSSDVELQNKNDIESWYTDVSDITLINEEGEAE